MATSLHNATAVPPEIATHLEVFCRDLLSLVRNVRVYPAAHPMLAERAQRLVGLVGAGLPDPLILGVTPTELVVDGAFCGGDDQVRSRDLAVYLHARRVLRVVWTAEAGPADVIGFAAVLADSAIRAGDLRKALQQRDIFTIDAEPLTYERIHGSFRSGDGATGSGRGAERGRQAWNWLLDEDVAPEKVAELLASDSFWQHPEGSGSDTPPADTSSLATVLLRIGQRLGTALECLPLERRRGVEERLAKLGRDLSPEELAGLLHRVDEEITLDSPLLEAVEQSLGGDRLVDMLANLVAMEGMDTRRMADIYRRFAPGGRAQELLPVVRARLQSAERGGLAVEIWAAVEEFLLSLHEGAFMGAEYSGSLERLTEAGTALAVGEGSAFCAAAELERHLDAVVIGTALGGGDVWRARLLDRLAARADQLVLDEFLVVLEDVDRELPSLLDSDPDFTEQVFRLGAQRLAGPDSPERRRFAEFILRHEGVLLNAVLRVLSEEERMSARRFLVDVLARCSAAATPILVTRVRSAPWYLARNLTIALGRRGEARTVPVVLSLLDHEHPKVRREAVVALGGYRVVAARQALRELATGTRGGEVQQLAARVLREGRTGEETR